MRTDPRIIKTDGVVEEALAGAKKMYEAVSRVYGPTSFNVALQKSYGSHVITHDGVTVAKDCVDRNQDQNIGMDELYKAARKTDDISGDGTSMTCVLGYHVMEKGHQRLAAGFNPMALRRGMRFAGQALTKMLDDLAVEVPDERLHEIATISSNDPEIGKIVADTVIKAGGVGITVEEYDGLGVLQDVIEGVYFEKGWAMPHFVNNAISEEVLHDDIHVICLEKRIRANQDLVPILEMIFDESEKANATVKPRVLIIGNVLDKALQTCVLTNRQGAISVCVVNPPVYGSQVLGFLEDVAAMTGGKVVPESLPAGKVTADYLGYCEKIIVGRNTTTILGSKGNPEEVAKRISDLKEQLDSDQFNAHEKERMERRLAKLQGKIGIIRVGGAIDTEREETIGRVRDAVYATRGAKEDGIVPGGGTTLARLSRLKLADIEGAADLPRDEQEGVQVVLDALAEPFKQLMTNAGEDPGYRLEQVVDSKAGFGFNVKEMKQGSKPIDLMKAGVIDPVRVIKSGVENSCSVAGTVITLGATLTIDREFQLEQIQLNRAMMGQ